MGYVGLFRHAGGRLVPFAVAGSLWFPFAAMLARSLPAGAAGQQAAEIMLDLAFVGVCVVVLLIDHERRSRAIRRGSVALTARLAAVGDDLAREVEARAAAEEALRLCRDQARDLAETSGAWQWETGPDHRLRSLSARVDPGGERVGRPLAALLDEASWPTLARRLRERAAFDDLPVGLRTPDDVQPATLSGRPWYGDNGVFGGFRGCGRDQTDRRAAEQMAQHHALVLSAIDEGVIGVGDDGAVLFANAAAAKLLGWPETAIEGAVGDLLTPEDGSLLADDMKRPHRMQRRGAEFRRLDGTPLPVDYVWMPRNLDGAASGGVIAFHGVTDRLRTEQELLEAKERAEAATQAKSDFLAAMSHELRTPLNAITGFSDIMLGELFGPIGNARYREYLGDIRTSGHHLLGLIDDVLDLSRIEAGRLDLDERPCDIGRIVDEALTMLRTTAARGGISLGDNVAGNLPAVRADARRLKQVLLTVVSNAIKFTPEGGRADVWGEIDGEGALVVRVTDTGIGISADQLARITEPFARGDIAVSRRHGGAGLSLPLAKQLMELHGGSLTVDSVVQAGTTVTLRLPPWRLITGADSSAGAAAD